MAVRLPGSFLYLAYILARYIYISQLDFKQPSAFDHYVEQQPAVELWRRSAGVSRAISVLYLPRP
jgi:hypothetical protein